MGPDLPKWWWYLRPFCAGAMPNASFSAAFGKVATVTKTVESISSAGLPSEPPVPQFPGLLTQGRLSDEGFSGECIDRLVIPTKVVYEAK